MRIAVLGTGSVGRTLAAKFDQLGHEVVVGTRDPEATRSRSAEPPWAEWESEHHVGLVTFAEAATAAELVVNASNGLSTLATLEAAGAANLAGKVLIDVANALDFSDGFPPRLAVQGDTSLGEQVQAAFPEARVVKTLNTMHADLMAEPRKLAAGGHTTFVSGNDDDAKRVVTALLVQLGHNDVIDLGDITTARGTEPLLALWVRLYRALGVESFQFKVVR